MCQPTPPNPPAPPAPEIRKLIDDASRILVYVVDNNGWYQSMISSAYLAEAAQ